MLDISELIGSTLPQDQPEIRGIVVSTITGSTSLNGSSSILGNDTDAALLSALRSWSDVVLVGANTVRAENYAGVQLTQEVQQQRESSGQQAIPPIAVISSSLNFDTQSRFFTETSVPPIVLTDSTSPTQIAALEKAGATVMILRNLTAEAIVDKLRAKGFARISCEGGTSLYAQLINAALIDVWHHTIDPRLTSNVENPIVSGDASHLETTMRLENALVDADSTLFLRFRRALPAPID